MKIEIDFDMGYETNIPWIEAIWGFVARQFKMIRLKRYESVLINIGEQNEKYCKNNTK